MISFIRFLTFALVLVTITVRAEIVDLTGEVWSVCGVDEVSTWHETRLVFTRQSLVAATVELEGYFDWRNNLRSFGREYFRGTLKADGTLSLEGFRLEESAAIVTSRYRAKLDKNGTAFINGVWLDGLPGKWAAVRDGGRGTGIKLCHPPDQIS